MNGSSSSSPKIEAITFNVLEEGGTKEDGGDVVGGADAADVVLTVVTLVSLPFGAATGDSEVVDTGGAESVGSFFFFPDSRITSSESSGKIESKENGPR